MLTEGYNFHKFTVAILLYFFTQESHETIHIFSIHECI